MARIIEDGGATADIRLREYINAVASEAAATGARVVEEKAA